MPTQDLKFRLLGEDKGASAALAKVQKQAGGAHDAFSKLGGILGNMGGPFGVAQDAISSLGAGFEHIKEHGKSVGTVLTGVGIAATGAGVLLAQFGAKDQQAQAQLRASVEQTGNSWGDFKGRVEDAIKAGEHFGHTADDTQNALNNLTTALQDPNKALAEMNLVTDLAAKKHISLAEASDTLIKAQEGNAKAFRSFGIVLDGNGTKTEQINRALDELSKRLSGQASAAADTFSGRLEAAKTRAEDYLSSLAKFAPLLTAIGPAATGVGAAIQYLNGKKTEAVVVDEALDAGAQQELANSSALVAASGDETAATTALVAAKQAEVGATAEVVAGESAEVAANTRLTASNEATAVSERGKGALLAGTGRLAKAGALALGGYVGGQVLGGIVGGTAGSILGSVGTGAGIGAAAGSVVPGLGTVVGAGIGAAAGGLVGAFNHGASGPSREQIAAMAASGPAGEARVKADLARLTALQRATGLGADEVKKYSGALKDSADAEKLAGDNATALAQKAAKLVPVLDKDIARLHGYADAALATGTSADAFQQSLNDLSTAADKNSHALTGTSDAAITNRNSLRQLAQQELAHVDALKAAHKDSTQVRAETLAMSTAFEQQAVKVFGNKKAVDAMLASLHLLPRQVRTDFKIDPADAAKRRLEALLALKNAIAGDARAVHFLAPGTIGRPMASGGLVSGGIPGRDSVPSLLMPGEFVVDAAGKNLHVSGGGGTVVNLVQNFHTPTDPVAVGRATDKVLRQFYSATGTAPIGA